MLLLNTHPDHGRPLDAADAEMLGYEAAKEAERFLSYRDNHAETPLHCLSESAAGLGLAAIHVKDEGHRLGLGSFKALGGAYAVIQLALDEAGRQLRRRIDIAELHTPAVRTIASKMTVACATDGNHGRSVAQGAQLVGGRAKIFVHSGVSDERVEAIARFGAEMIRVEGTYDDSVKEAARIAAGKGWIIVSDTSWPGYEHIPAPVMQGYTAMVRETLRQLPQLAQPCLCAGRRWWRRSGGRRVSGCRAWRAAPGLCHCRSGACRLHIRVRARRSPGQDPARRTDRHGDARMLQPSLIAWRMLARVADAFMTVDEDDAVAAMNCLARPAGNDVAIVAGESGGAGLAGLMRATATIAAPAAA